jgi:tRNA A-37 threonylcarbamoyl transferase component Bud32
MIPGLSVSLARFLESGDWRRGAVVVKRNRRRTVYRCQPPEGELAVYVKEDVAHGLRDRVKSLFRCKAEAEFAALAAVGAAGIPVVRPLGWARLPGGGMLATEEMPGQSLQTALQQDPVGRMMGSPEFRHALGAFLHRVLRAGLAHPDMHEGNLLLDWTGGEPVFALVDLYGARLCRSVSRAAKQRMIRWLYPHLQPLPSCAQRAMLQQIAAGDPEAERLGSWPGLAACWAKFWRDRWRGWRRQMLRSSSVCEQVVDTQGTWLLRRNATTPEELAHALHAYRSLQPAEDGRPTCVNGAVVVKEYAQPDQARRSWLAMMRTAYLVPVAPGLGWLRAVDGRSYVFRRYAEGGCLADRLRESESADWGDWPTQVASIMARLHLCHCSHADFRLDNWMVSMDGRVMLLDCDDVRQFRRFPESARERALRQLAESCPPNVTRREKLRFLARYGRQANLSPARLRRLAGLFPS